MRQAEDWLREALQLYPDDPQILSSAARFEQARGHSERAADFWGLAAVAWFLAPGKYLTTAVLQFPRLRGVTDGEDRLADFQRTQASLIKSPSLIQKVLASQDIQELPEVHTQGEGLDDARVRGEPTFSGGGLVVRGSLGSLGVAW